MRYHKTEIFYFNSAGHFGNQRRHARTPQSCEISGLA
jgi:hypothetical protein